MEYVMVPVPEEHVAEVQKFIAKSIVAPVQDGSDPGAVTRLIGDLDERTRAVLLFTAKAADEGLDVTVQGASEAIGCSEHEVLGLCTELNVAVADAGGPGLTLVPVLDAGPVATARPWPLIMNRDVARLLRSVAGSRPDQDA
jgi:hypothetical protein